MQTSGIAMGNESGRSPSCAEFIKPPELGRASAKLSKRTLIDGLRAHWQINQPK